MTATTEREQAPQAMTLEEAFTEANKRALVVHFYENGYVEVLDDGLSVGFKAGFLPALSEALGRPVVARDEASELRAAIREWVEADKGRQQLWFDVYENRRGPDYGSGLRAINRGIAAEDELRRLARIEGDKHEPT